MNTMAPTRLTELQSHRVWLVDGRGLLLVATLSAEWGFYRTATGKAVYFTLAGPPEPVLSELPRPRPARK